MSLPSRVAYAVRTVEAACFLAQGSAEQEVVNTILRRAGQMLLSVWEHEVKLNVAPEPELSLICMKAFWDVVAENVSPSVVYKLLVVYGEDLNPNGEHNVAITMVPARSATTFAINLECP